MVVPDQQPAGALPAAGHAVPPDAAVERPARGPLRHALALVRETLPPLHPGGRPVIGAVAAGALAVRVLRGRGTWGAVAVTAGVAAFFRAPARVTPRRAGVAVAPADGTVSVIDEAEPPAELVEAGLPAGRRPRVSVFLSVYDVHVQRLPVDGQVRAARRREGTFVSADLPQASDDNSRLGLWVHGTEGHDLASVQIAGLVARRIVCDVAAGDEVRAGDVYGLIRFGSRVDLFLPAGSRIEVGMGQRTVGGETVVATLPAAATLADRP